MSKRIINDQVCFKGVGDDVRTPEIRAVSAMYNYLHTKGILENISMKYFGDDNGAIFTFDAEKLEPYREQMLNSGVENAEMAVDCIMDRKFKPCIYCGAITPGWYMMTYRDNCGCVSKSWECGMCKNFNNETVHTVSEKRQDLGIESAIEELWKYYDK